MSTTPVLGKNWLDREIESRRASLERMQDSTNPEIVLARRQWEEKLAEMVETQTALAQAAELALHVERAAKGELEKAARRYLSLPYAQQLEQRLRQPTSVTSDMMERARKFDCFVVFDDEALRRTLHHILIGDAW